MLSQEWRRAAHHTGRLSKINRRCDIFELANYGMLKLGKKANFIQMRIFGEITSIACHANGASQCLPFVKKFSFSILHIPGDQPRLKLIGSRSTLELILQNRFIIEVTIIGK